MAAVDTVTRTGRAVRGAGLAALVALALSACEGADDGPAPPRSDTATPSRSPSPEPSPEVTALDGTDTAACADGDCQVAVSEPVAFPFEGPNGQAELSVTSVGPNTVEYTVTREDGEISGGSRGQGSGCVSSLYDSGGGTSCGQVGAPPSPAENAVFVQVEPGEDGTAVITIVSG
ncbi:hypothetical protein ACIBFB_05645 [Nocardiopsis sp. NPDC050513]|uniref:hypothetical protein n=1 Tax=Nocardiopsis sp. NPDC050513 TaxID=3364338 RepID=UPI003793AA6A